MEQLITRMTAGGFGNMLKKPVIVTDRYLGEKYLPREVLDMSSGVAYHNFGKELLDQTKVIIMRNCDLDGLPEWVYDLEHLEGLLLDNNPELKLANELCKLKNLKVLGLQQTSINNYSFLNHLENLESVDISGNFLTEYPLELCSLENLLYLDISTYNKFTAIPSCIEKNKKLRVLRAHFNEISNIPEEIGFLENLEQLIIGGNNIKIIPDSIYNLTKLRELDIFKNNIREVDFRKLSKLEDLDEIFLSDNPIEDFPSDLLHQNKGILSSKALNNYYATDRYLEISKDITNDELQKSRLLRSARAIIFRGLFYGLKKDWINAYNLVHGGYKLARDLKNNKLSILAAVFLGYLEVIKAEEQSIEVFLKGSEWANKINEFWRPYEDEKYRQSFNEHLLKYAFLTELNITNGYKDEQDFELLLEKVFSNNYDLIKIDEEDEITHATLYGESSHTHPTKVENARNDINNRDLLRAYIELDLFEKAWNEVARQYSSVHSVFPIKSCFPSDKNEVYLYIFQLTNRDKIRVVVAKESSQLIYFDLDSISIDLNKITTGLLLNDIVDRKPERFDFFESMIGEDLDFTEMIWNTIFGSTLINMKVDQNKKTDITLDTLTLHQYFINENISKLNIFPFASTLGIPFYSAFNGNTKKFLLDDYEIKNRPMFFLNKENFYDHSVNEAKSIFTVTHSDLHFAKSEGKLIKEYYSDVIYIEKYDKNEIFRLMQNSSIIHIASHSKESEIIFKISGEHIKIKPEEIKELNLQKCSLVFLNACRTSEEAYVSLISTSSLPLAFLEAGARTVISTTREINDDDAFRISMRFHEISCKKHYDYSNTFRRVLTEAKNNELPYYENELERYGYIDLSSSMKYYKHHDKHKGVNSWKYYTIWENNYHE
ncbi:MAG: leucine-rich repeat domain-containing protein [bacterium]